jgi:hypothetical protein
MKTYPFAGLLLLAAAHLAPPALAACPPDTLAAPAPDPPQAERPWYRPQHLVLQTAGGLGMVAAGAGYEYGKNRLETDILLGYVPKHFAGSTLSMASLKMLYSPFRLQLTDKVQLLPVTLGAYFSYTHGTLNDELKGQYSSDYYWFSTDTRYGPLLGSRLTYLGAPVAATGQPRKISFYYDLGTNDLYLASYLSNRNGGISLGQILTLALGVKADF